MKTSNKILLGGFIAVVIFLLVIFFRVTSNISEAVETMKKNRVEKTIDPGNIDALHATGELKIEWTPGSDNRMEIKTNKSAYEKLTYETEKGKLILKMKDDSKVKPIIRITADTINQITLEDGAIIETEEAISQEKLNIMMASNSLAMLYGNVHSATIRCASKSTLHASQLVLNTCNMKTDTEAFAKIHVKQKLELTANGGSEVEYSGSPETTNIDTQGGSTIKEK